MTKPTKWHVRPAKTQISLGIRPVWSESSPCAQWVAEHPMVLHAYSEDSDQTGRMPRLIWVFAGRTCHFVGFVMRLLKCVIILNCMNYNQNKLRYIKNSNVYNIYIFMAWFSMLQNKIFILRKKEKGKILFLFFFLFMYNWDDSQNIWEPAEIEYLQKMMLHKI